MPSDRPTSEKDLHTSSLAIDKLIACGKFPVYHARAPASKTEYALKLFPLDRESSSLFSQEFHSLAPLNHPNILKYVSHNKMRVAEDTECNILITEYAPYGDFYDLVMSKRLQGDERLARHFFHQLIAGIEYLHSQHHLAHCDLKLENLLLGKDGLLKIADFDQARTSQENRTPLHGTEGYRAPELLEDICHNIYSIDIYSAGVVLYILITGEMPFAEIYSEEGRRTIEGYDEFCETNEIFWSKKATRHGQNLTLRDEAFQDLINGMLDRNAEQGWSLDQIKQSKWFNGGLYEEEELKGKLQRILKRKC